MDSLKGNIITILQSEHLFPLISSASQSEITECNISQLMAARLKAAQFNGLARNPSAVIVQVFAKHMNPLKPALLENRRRLDRKSVV